MLFYHSNQSRTEFKDFILYILFFFSPQARAEYTIRFFRATVPLNLPGPVESGDFFLHMFILAFCCRLNYFQHPPPSPARALTTGMLTSLKVHKHEIFFVTFFAETETIWSQGPVTRDF
jgi:hypothetical protein